MFKINKSKVVLAFAALLLASCSSSPTSPSSSEAQGSSSSDTGSASSGDSKLTQAEWNEAFAGLDAGNMAANVLATQTSGVSAVTMEDSFIIADDKAKVDAKTTQTLTFTLADFDGEEDDLAYYLYIYQAAGYELETDSEPYILSASVEENYYLEACDSISHYEYLPVDDVERKDRALDSFEDYLNDLLVDYTDMCVSYSSASYDEATKVYSIDETALTTFMLEGYDNEVTDASLSFTFNDKKQVSSMKLAYTSESTDYTFDCTFSGYGEQSVSLPEYVPCNHLGTTSYEIGTDMHAELCDICDSVLEIKKHDYDATGTCKYCEYQPSSDYIYELGEVYDAHQHIVATYSDVTGDLIDITINENGYFTYTNYDYDNPDGSVIFTYTSCNARGECDLKIVLTMTYTKDESCLETKKFVYEFFDGNNEKIVDDLVLESSYYDHDYDVETVDEGNCKYHYLYTCPDCGDTYTKASFYDHDIREVKVFDEEAQTGTVHCVRCNRDIVCEGLCVDEDVENELMHEMIMVWTEPSDGLRYSQSFDVLHEPNANWVCTVCGYRSWGNPLEETACDSCIYWYHAFFALDEIQDGRQMITSWAIKGMEEEEIEDEDGLVNRVVWTCADCGACVILDVTKSGHCTVNYTNKFTVYDRYKDLVGVYYYDDSYDEGHYYDWNNPTIEWNSTHCIETKTYTCVYCGATYVQTLPYHDYNKECVVDPDTGVHTVTETCSKCQDVQVSTYEGHVYQKTATHDRENHCFGTAILECAYCDEVFASGIDDGFYPPIDHREKDDATVVAENVKYSKGTGKNKESHDNGILTVDECKYCGDFIDFHFSGEGYYEAISSDSDTGDYVRDYGSVTIKVTSELKPYSDDVDYISVRYRTILITDDESGSTLYTATYPYSMSVNESKLGGVMSTATYGGYVVTTYQNGYVTIG